MSTATGRFERATGPAMRCRRCWHPIPDGRPFLRCLDCGGLWRPRRWGEGVERCRNPECGSPLAPGPKWPATCPNPRCRSEEWNTSRLSRLGIRDTEVFVRVGNRRGPKAIVYGRDLGPVRWGTFSEKPRGPRPRLALRSTVQCRRVYEYTELVEGECRDPERPPCGDPRCAGDNCRRPVGVVIAKRHNHPEDIERALAQARAAHRRRQLRLVRGGKE